MAEVILSTGIDKFDARLNEIPRLAHLFEALNMGRLSAKSRTHKGQPVIHASSVDVALFTNIDNEMSYAVKSYADLDNGRILLSDFVVNQVWKSAGSEQVMSWVDEEGKTIVDNLGSLTTALAWTADAYRLAHFARSVEK